MGIIFDFRISYLTPDTHLTTLRIMRIITQIVLAGILLSFSVSATMKIFVKKYGKIFTLDVELNETIQSVKGMIQDKEGIQPEKQFLFFGGKLLKDGKSLSDYAIEEKAELLLLE